MRKTNVFSKGIVLAFLLLLTVPFSAFSQDLTVSGSVMDQQGGPLPGVSILIEGTSTGVITDIDGNYSLNAPGTSVLIFNFLGFESQKVSVDNRSTINVVLRESFMSLDEVVVVGYGSMRRTDVTGSMVSVSSEAIEKSVPTSIDQVLQGRAAGVQVQQNSGAPGSSSSIRIRGVNSINATNEPIFVIDGVVIDGNSGSSSNNPLASINPSDILTMDVLKDASATAIYGSRGANGVILITTKRGEKGMARVTYDGYMGYQEIPTRLDLMDLRQYAEHKNERAEANIVNDDSFFIDPSILGKGTDWQDALYQRAFMQSHNLSVSGGSEKSTYALGLGYLDQEGIAIGSGFERITLRGNFDSQVKDWLKAGVNFSLSNTNQVLSIGSDNANNDTMIKTAMKQTPNVSVRNAEGTFDGPDDNMYVQTNPVGLASIRENDRERLGIRSGIFLEATLLKGLTLKTELSSDFNMNNEYRFTPSYRFGALSNDVIQSERVKTYSKYWSWNNVLNYTRTLNEVHSVNAMLGQEMQESQWEYLYGYRSGFLNNAAHDLNAGDGTTSQANGNSGQHAMMSYFGRIFYSYDDRYMLTTTLRHDGSSNFSEDNRWGWFPSAAVAWRISNESFLRDNLIVSNLRLRAGWGKVGNQNVPSYAYTSVMSSVTTVWGTGQLAGNTANPALQWETTQSSNLGLDVSLFQNRVEFIADVYHKKTDNLLLRLPLPAYMGSQGQGATTPPWANVGSLENKGIELTLNTVNVDRGGFQWRSNLVFSLNRNKVVELDTETSTLDVTVQEGSEVTPVTRTVVGKPIGQFYGYKVIGRFNKGTDFYYKDANGQVKEVARPEGIGITESGVWIGDYIFEDVDGDGVINDSDRTFIGNPEPKFTFGIGNSFAYKGFDLSVQLGGSFGNDVINYQRRWLENPRENHNLLVSARDYARLGVVDANGPENDYRNLEVVGGADDMYRLSASSSNANNRMSNRYVEDGSYLRIQNISLGYNLPRRWVEQIGMENAKIYANLQNVYTWTKYSGYDPEVGAHQQNALLSGVDNARYPSPRIYTLGLNLTF